MATIGATSSKCSTRCSTSSYRVGTLGHIVTQYEASIFDKRTEGNAKMIIKKNEQHVSTNVSTTNRPKVTATVYMTNHGDSCDCDIEYTYTHKSDITPILDGFSFDFLSADLFEPGDDGVIRIDAERFDEINFGDKVDCGYFNDVIVALKDTFDIASNYDEYRIEISPDGYVAYLVWRNKHYGDARGHLDAAESERVHMAARRIVRLLEHDIDCVLRQDIGDAAETRFKQEMSAALHSYVNELFQTI